MRWSARPRWLGWKAGVAVLGLLLAVFAWKLQQEVAVWRSTPALYLETMKRSPGAALIAHNLASYYYDGGDLENALKWDTTALELWEKSFIKNRNRLGEILAGLGAVYYRQGAIDSARVKYQAAYQAAPEDDGILCNIGIFHVGLQEYDQALKFFEAALRANPANVPAASNAAGICIMTGKLDRAISYAQRAIAADPNYGDAYLNLARAYVEKGRKEEARRTYMAVKRIDPSKASLADAELRLLSESR